MNQPLTIFRAGRHTAMNGVTLEFSEADLQAIAAGYDPAVSKAPLVIGHPRTDDPAWGWVRSLDHVDGTLRATVDQVEAAFAELVNAGRYKKISASFFTPTAPSNPTPGAYYLRHVGFLGAQAPAIPGLPDAAFADDGGDGVVCIEFSASHPHPDKEHAMTPEALAAKAAELDERARKLEADSASFAAREQQLAQAEAAARVRRIDTALEGLVAAGKLLPAEKPGMAAFMASIPDDSQVSFAEGGQVVKVTGPGFLEKFLGNLPDRVNFAEVSGAERDAPAAASFAAPPGYTVDPEGLARHARIQAHAAKHNISYDAALAAIGPEGGAA